MKLLKSPRSFLWLMSFIYLSISGCSPIFIPDPTEHLLPAYSAEGKETAGAFINDELWLGYSDSDSFLTNRARLDSYENDSLVFQIRGEMNGNEVFIRFHLTATAFEDFNQVTTLNGITFELDGSVNSGSFSQTNIAGNTVFTGGVGELHLRRIKNVSDFDRYTISGTFGFTLEADTSEELNVFYGRFDYDISADVNYFIER